MNNTKNILLIALITATLILGTSVIPMQSYADEDKITKDSKSSIKASTEVDKKSASQKLDQENFCYRGDDCEQANQGQQIVGKDNEAKGFNDQSKNIQQSLTPTATPAPGNGTTPAPLTCEECISSHNLPTQAITTVTFACERANQPGESIGLTGFINALGASGVDINTSLDLVQCLKDLGVQFAL
jgi:hypothetical protein